MTLAKTEASTRLSKDLKKRGWSFVGPTTVYAFMQAMGLVNDMWKAVASGTRRRPNGPRSNVPRDWVHYLECVEAIGNRLVERIGIDENVLDRRHRHGPEPCWRSQATQAWTDSCGQCSVKTPALTPKGVVHCQVSLQWSIICPVSGASRRISRVVRAISSA